MNLMPLLMSMAGGNQGNPANLFQAFGGGKPSGNATPDLGALLKNFGGAKKGGMDPMLLMGLMQMMTANRPQPAPAPPPLGQGFVPIGDLLGSEERGILRTLIEHNRTRSDRR